MIIQPSTFILPDGRLVPEGAGALRTLQIGEVVQALVLSRTDGGVVKLLINGMEVSAQTGLELRQGQTMQLEVLRGGRLPLMKVVAEAAPQSLSAIAMRTMLVRQQPVATLWPKLESLVRNLQQVANQSSSGRLRSMILPVVREAETFIEGMAAARGRDASSLRTAVLQSGVMQSKHGLRHGRDATASDTRLHLSKLVSRIDQVLSRASGGRNLFSSSNAKIAAGQNVRGYVVSSQGLIRASASSDMAPRTGDFLPRVLSGGAVTDSHGGNVSSARGLMVLLSQLLQPLGMVSHSQVLAAERSLSFLHGQEAASPKTPIQGRAGEANSQGHISKTTGQADFMNMMRELREHSDSWLSRIEYQQWRSVASSGDRTKMVYVDLPVQTEQHGIVFIPMRLSHRMDDEVSEGNDSYSSDSGWGVRLELDLGPLGELDVHVWQKGEKTTVTFWVENPGTRWLILNRVEFLEASMREKGIDIADINIRSGQMGERQEVLPMSGSRGLMDIMI